MRLPQKKAKIVQAAITALETERAISPETANVIRAQIEPISFDWRRLARYSFIAAIICLVISVLTTVFDEAIVRWVERILPLITRLFNAPPIVRSCAMLLLSAAILWFGLKRRARSPDRIYSNEAVFTFAVLGIAGAAYTLSQMDQYANHGAYLATLAGFVYLLLGGWLESKVVWCYGLFTLSGALGAGTGYAMGGYYLWEHTPVRSLLYGLALVGGVVGLQASLRARPPKAAIAARRILFIGGVTRVIGLLHVFISLWVLSIWGSSEHPFNSHAFQWDCLIWAVLFGAVAAVAVAQSLAKDDSVLRGFGLTFFFINLYTVFFQYFWNGLHKAIFFAILGLSFWLLGRKAESLWKGNILRNHSEPPADS